MLKTFLNSRLFNQIEWDFTLFTHIYLYMKANPMYISKSIIKNIS